MNNQSYMRVVTLKDLWDILIHRLWIMILAAIAVASSTYGIMTLTFVPRYASTATLYILYQSGEDYTSTASASDFSLALNVVNDCTYLLKSHAVLDEVIDLLQLTVEYDDLYDSISTSNPDNTRILEVTVEADTPEQAKELVDVLCEIGQEKITDAMGFQQVNFYEKGTLNDKPCNQVSLLTYLLIGMIAAIAVYSGFLIAFLLDDRIRSQEDIEKYLGLSVLGEIPSAGKTSKGKYGYYSAYGYGQKRKKKGDRDENENNHA